MNIALKDASELTPGSTKQYHDDLVDLANPNINKTIINTHEAIEDNELLSDMFRRFPMYIFMQGGMNKNEFSFNSILPYSDKSSPYSTIMNDALVRTSEALKWTKYTDEKTVPENALRKVNKTGKYYAKSGLLNRVLNKFLENNNIKNRKANQATAFKNLLEPMVLAPLLKGNKRKTIIDILKYYKPVIKRLTYTSEDLVYTLNTTNITKGEMTELASLYQGEAFFITDNPIFKDSSIGLKTDSIAEIDDSLDTMFDVLGDGKALIFNENGYYSPDKVLQDHITTKLFEKFGIVNTPIQPARVIIPRVTGTKVISNEDIAAFNNYLTKSGGVKREEFFTSKTTFKIFFNPETGKREKAPQSATWVLNLDGLYDLVDKEVGEVYISNVDLATGYQMIDEPVVNTPVIKPIVKTISEAYGVKTAETNPSVEKTKQFINLIQPQIIYILLYIKRSKATIA